MRVLEIYATVQGEGIDVGRPAVFVRMAGCSVGCVWCDTKESWGFDRPAVTPAAVAAEVLRVADEAGLRSVVVTGGEPLQQPAAELAELTARLRQAGFHLAVETSGHFLPNGLATAFDLWTVSPKLPSAQARLPFTSERLQTWVAFARSLSRPAGSRPSGLQLKFVISHLEDVAAACRLIAAAEAHRAGIPIIFQPEASQAAHVFPRLPSWLHQHWPDWQHWDVRLIPQVHKLLGLP